MANKPKTERPTDAQVEAAKEIYEVARRDADAEIQKMKIDLDAAKEDYEAIGFIKCADMDIEFKKLMKYLTIYKILKAKDYRKAGMTKEQFLDAIGEPYKTTDRVLDDVAPIYEAFSDKMSNFFGLKFNEIKLLGKTKLDKMSNFEGEYIIYKGEKIHISESPIVIRRIEDDTKKQLEDKDAEINAQKRTLALKADAIKKMEREIKRLEKTVEVSDLSPEDQEQIDLLKELQANLQRLIYTVRQKIDFRKSSKEVLRQLYFLYIFGSKILMDERMALNDAYADADEVPWEIMEEELPPSEVLVDNLPLTKGMGKAYKEKIEKRKS